MATQDALPPGALSDEAIDALIEQAHKTNKQMVTYQVARPTIFMNDSKVYKLVIYSETKHRVGRHWYYFICQTDWIRKCGHDADNYLFTNYWLAHAYFRRQSEEHMR